MHSPFHDCPLFLYAQETQTEFINSVLHPGIAFLKVLHLKDVQILLFFQLNFLKQLVKIIANHTLYIYALLDPLNIARIQLQYCINLHY